MSRYLDHKYSLIHQTNPTQNLTTKALQRTPIQPLSPFLCLRLLQLLQNLR